MVRSFLLFIVRVAVLRLATLLRLRLLAATTLAEDLVTLLAARVTLGENVTVAEAVTESAFFLVSS